MEAKFFNQIGFTALRQQKEALMCAIQEAENIDNLGMVYDLTGLLNLIDDLQDYAVDELGFSEEQVFNLENSEK